MLLFYLQAVQRFLPELVWAAAATVKPVSDIVIPEASASLVTTPVEPVRSKLSPAVFSTRI